MTLEDGVKPLSRHPVAGLSPTDRQLAHAEALGEILAAIALRKADQSTEGGKALRPLANSGGARRRQEQEVTSGF